MKKLALILASLLIGTSAHAAATFTETNVNPGDGQAQKYVTEQSPSGGETGRHTTQSDFPIPKNLASQTGSTTTPPTSTTQTGSSALSRFIGPLPEVILLGSGPTTPTLPKTGPGAALIFIGAMTAALISKRK